MSLQPPTLSSTSSSSSGSQSSAFSETDSSSAYDKFWVETFVCQKGNELFCEVDEDFILDRFNLTGLQNQIPYYSLAFDVITDALEEDDIPTEYDRTEIEKAARHLYGLIHARFIITARGLQKMADLYQEGSFGRCPRVLCSGQPVLPVGLFDVPGKRSVRLYCPHCEDVYNPPSRRHSVVDGAYFGTTFPHLFFQIYSALSPTKNEERYKPKIFGFNIHKIADEQRRQVGWKVEQIERRKGH